MQSTTLTPESFRRPGGIGFILSGLCRALAAAATAWRIGKESVDATANQ